MPSQSRWHFYKPKTFVYSDQKGGKKLAASFYPSGLRFIFMVSSLKKIQKVRLLTLLFFFDDDLYDLAQITFIQIRKDIQ